METTEVYEQNTEEHWAGRGEVQGPNSGLIIFSDGTGWELKKDEGKGRNNTAGWLSLPPTEGNQLL